jgi:hypothetical protein
MMKNFRSQVQVPRSPGFSEDASPRNAPAGNHQLVAEDLMEDGTVNRISNAYSLGQGRRLPPTSEVEELQFVIVIVMGRRKTKPPLWGGKL